MMLDRSCLGVAVWTTLIGVSVCGGAGAQTPAQQGQPALSPVPILLDPITVTARRVQEPIRTVPFGISAVQSEALRDQRIEETRDLFRVIPNFNYSDVGVAQSNVVNMRGIGSSSTFLSPSVTYYIDGVPVPSRAFDQQFLDVERIEVLRGPQGTLFGQNSQAGAVSIVTVEPTDRPEFEIGGEYGNFDAYRVTATAGGSITDRLSGRVHGQVFSRDGDIRNVLFAGPTTIAGSDETIREQLLGAVSGRAQLDIGSDTTAALAGRFRRDRRNPTTGLLLDDPEFPRNSLDPRPENAIDAGGGSLTVEHDFGDIRLTSVTGLQVYDLELSADITDGFLASASSGAPPVVFGALNSLREIDEDMTQWSQELRFDGETSGGVRWVAGASGLYSDFTSGLDTTSPMAPNGLYVADIERVNLAAFGEVTVPLSDRLRFIGGLRLNRETNAFDGRFSGRPGGAPALPAFTESGRTEDTLITGRAGLSYDLMPDLSTYVTIARGAKAGGFPFFNSAAGRGVASQPFEDSATLSYEAGVRGTLWQNRLSLSAAVFFNDTTDEQLFVVNPIAGLFQAENADTETYGAELELTARPLTGLSLSGSLGLLQTEVTNAAAGSTVSEGNDVSLAPNLTASVGAEYRVALNDLGVPGDAFLAADYQFVGSREIDPANTARLDSYDLVHLRAGVSGERFDVYAFARNVLDEEFAVWGFRAGTSPTGAPVIGGTPGFPRTFGIGARIRF